jgi:hypothetical protein
MEEGMRWNEIWWSGMAREVDQIGEKVKRYACAASNRECATRRSSVPKTHMAKSEEEEIE